MEKGKRKKIEKRSGKRKIVVKSRKEREKKEHKSKKEKRRKEKF